MPFRPRRLHVEDIEQDIAGWCFGRIPEGYIRMLAAMFLSVRSNSGTGGLVSEVRSWYASM